jgi:hypothetical protein
LRRRGFVIVSFAHYYGDGVLRASAQDELDATFDLTAGQQHTPTTSLTLQANVSAEPNHSPVAASTGMRLAQPHPVIETEIGVFHEFAPSVWFTARYNDRISIYDATVSGVR